MTPNSLLRKVLKTNMDLRAQQHAPSIPLSTGQENSPETGGDQLFVLRCSLPGHKRPTALALRTEDFVLGLSAHQKCWVHVGKANVDDTVLLFHSTGQ